MTNVKNFRLSKKIISLILALILTVSTAVVAFAVDDGVTLNPEAYPKFADKSQGALYAHATLGGDSAQAWQKWSSGYSGVNAQSGVRYFFLPNTADDSRVEIYNNYGEQATAGNVTIAPYTSAVVNYTKGKEINVKVSTKSYKLVVYKSDSEASVYVNDTTNSYIDADGRVQNTDLYSFLIQNKENSVKGSDCAIAGNNTVSETTLKKIKGRGNTNWRDTDKKPFNLNFNSAVTIGHTTDKKFSFVSNAKDSTLLRNTIMYDLANDVGSPYAPDQSFIDFFVNGVYRGCYIACQKVDLGKSALVSLKDNSDTQDTDFSFLVEVDVWNYESDVYFVTDNGYHVVLKTPDLDGYDESDPSMKAKYDYIESTYAKLERALYGGTLSDIEKICDLNSLATQYLLQDLGKNCDGGYTSTYFTYNADEGKFYASPIWDCDSCLGAVDCIRDGCSESTCYYKGWTTRNAIYSSNRNTTVNPYGQAFYVKGTSSDGKTFEQICSEIWKDKFIPKINILLGNAPSDGKLKSIDSYASSISQAQYNNYIMWDFMWYCSRYNSGLNKNYSHNYDGEINYLKDWTSARSDWMTSQLTGDKPIDPSTSPSTDPNPDPALKTVYFKNTLGWKDVNYFAWTGGVWTVDKETMVWPGKPAELIGTDENGVEIYKASIDPEFNFIIFDEGYDGEQTVDISLSDAFNMYTATTSTGKLNSAKKDIYNVSEGVYESPATNPTSATSDTSPTSPTSFTSTTDPTTPSGQKDIYFVNNLGWDTVNFYTWKGNNSNSRWPGEKAELIGKNADGYPVYKAVFDSKYEYIIFNNGDNGQQTQNIDADGTKVLTINPDSFIMEGQKYIYDVFSDAYADNPIVGDVNLDKTVNVSDVTVIQKKIVKALEFNNIQEKIADTNADSKVNIRDATLIQMYIAKMLKSF